MYLTKIIISILLIKYYIKLYKKKKKDLEK